MLKHLRRLPKPNPEKEKKLREEIEKDGGLEKNDEKAMIFSALIVILPICFALLAIITVIAFLIFRLF